MKKKLSKKAVITIIAAAVVVRIFLIITAGTAALLAVGSVIDTVCGETESAEEHVTKTLPQSSDYDMWVFGVRDYTVYGKYYYEEEIPESVFDKNELFEKVTEDNIMPIRNIISDYENWIAMTKENSSFLLGDGLCGVYDFDINLLRDDCCYYYFEAESLDDLESDYQKTEPEDFNQNDYYSYTLYVYCGRILYIMHNDT